MSKVSIIGIGFVGKAMQHLFPNAIVYSPSQGFSDESAFNADFIFVCVPTPLKDGKLDCSIVEETVSKCAKNSVVILRSTVNPGFSDEMEKKYCTRIIMMPEYIGETTSHPLLDETKRQFFIIGGKPENRRAVIELYHTVYNANVTIRQVSAYEAEVIKLTENRAIAFKMMQVQELYDACEKSGIDFYTIREAVYGDDPRFNLWFTFVFPDKRGFNNSKCLAKDVPAWCAWAESIGADAEVTKLLVEKSKEYEENSSNSK